MKDNVCKRTNEELAKALKEASEGNRKLAKIIRSKNKQYQQLYLEYIKLKRRIQQWGSTY